MIRVWFRVGRSPSAEDQSSIEFANRLFACSCFASLSPRVSCHPMVASRADASEMVSPSYLWDPVNSFSISRILICGDHPEKIDYHHGDFPKGPRLALYRNMSSQYFTTREEDSLNYDMPLNMEMVEDNEKFQRIVFTQSDESGAQKPYAELKVFPHGNPIWIRYDSKDHHRIEDKCRGYRFPGRVHPPRMSRRVLSHWYPSSARTARSVPALTANSCASARRNG